MTFLSFFILFILNTCDLSKEDAKPSTEDLLTAHKWRLIQSDMQWAGNEEYEGYHNTDYYQESCEQDNYWIFDTDYSYEMNRGSNKCEPDETRIEDWGWWELDESREESEYIILWIYTDNPEIVDVLPEVPCYFAYSL